MSDHANGIVRAATRVQCTVIFPLHRKWVRIPLRGDRSPETDSGSPPANRSGYADSNEGGQGWCDPREGREMVPPWALYVDFFGFLGTIHDEPEPSRCIPAHQIGNDSIGFQVIIDFDPQQPAGGRIERRLP